jgi:ATP-binding cassette subfamily B protein
MFLKNNRVSTGYLKDILAQFSYLQRALRLTWAAAPYWTGAWAVLLVVQGLLPAATVYLTRLLIDGLVTAMENAGDWAYIQPALHWASMMAGTLLLTELLQSVLVWLRTAQAEIIQDYLSDLIHQKSITVDLAFYESPTYLDRYYRARYDAISRPLSVLENGGSLVQNGITLLAMGSLLLPYGVWLPLALVLSTLPALYVVIRFNRRYHHWLEQSTVARRRAQYYDLMLTQSAPAAELRLFDLGPHFKTAYQTLRQRLRTERLKLSENQGLAQVAAGGMGLVVTGLAMGWIVWRALQGQATLGDVTLFYQAFNRGQALLRSLLQNIGQIYSHSLFLGNLFEFLDLEPQVVDPPQPIATPSVLQQGIRFRQITFRYPGSERLALRDFNLTIPAGQTVAIVGANGAGKSTLIKLLCRFYDLAAGSIDFDGLDLRNFSLSDLRRQITVLFQSPVPYQDTAATNIALSDLPATPNQVAIETAARGASAHEVIERLPQGYETQLGKWFAGGTDLSGGEWQRIALARAFYRDAQIVILDEPTSAMDSWAEAEWLARFRDLVKGRTAIIITHRFTTAMQADIIHVMDQGQIIESGSHAELMAQNGRYAESWQAQMRAGREAAADLARPEAAALNPASANGSGPYSFVKVSPDQPTGSAR